VPRLSRISRRRREEMLLTPDLAEFLSWGGWLFDGDRRAVDIATEWERHGAELLAAWVADRPGSRPWAWWRIVGVPAHGPRRQLLPGPEAVGPSDWFGIASVHRAPTVPGQYESEGEYLRRHKLLLDGELAAAQSRGTVPAESGVKGRTHGGS